MTLPIRLHMDTPIVGQIEVQIRALVESGTLAPGVRLPSVRRLAGDLEISTFTVATAYDRLVAANYIRPRSTAGYFVVEKQLDALAEPVLNGSLAKDSFWLFALLQESPDALKAGSGVLPPEWFDDMTFKRSWRAALRRAGASFTAYPSAMGHRPLRDLLALKLIDLGISVQPDQIMLTSGASHAIDLTVRTLVAPGETVIVEEPGYSMLYTYLRSERIPFIAVPRLTNGLDMECLERALQVSKAKLLIVSSILHNPTGYTLNPINAHRLLGLAEQHQMHILEDDTYGDFHPGPTFRLANLDQLNRVIYVSSFSKTISASLRSGFLAANKQLTRLLLARKSITSLATSDFTERMVAELLASGDYRRQIERFRQKLTLKRSRVIARLQSLGFETPSEPAGGFYVWARSTTGMSTDRLSDAALTEGLVLAPGSVFTPTGTHNTWARFNVAFCDTPDFEKRMRASLARAAQ